MLRAITIYCCQYSFGTIDLASQLTGVEIDFFNIEGSEMTINDSRFFETYGKTFER